MACDTHVLEARESLNKQLNGTPQSSREARSQGHMQQEVNTGGGTIEMETKTGCIELINNYLFKRINKIDQPLAIPTTEKGEKTQINKIRHEKGVLTTLSGEIWITRENL